MVTRSQPLCVGQTISGSIFITFLLHRIKAFSPLNYFNIDVYNFYFPRDCLLFINPEPKIANYLTCVSYNYRRDYNKEFYFFLVYVRNNFIIYWRDNGFIYLHDHAYSVLKNYF